MVTIEIDIGKGPRAVEVNPKRITLGFLEDIEEAQKSGEWRPLITAISSLVGFTREETRALTVEQFAQISSALRDAIAQQTAIPNG